MTNYTEYNPNSHLFPSQVTYGRDPDLYPKKSDHVITTGGWADIDVIIDAVVNILKQDGFLDGITVDEAKIANDVVNYLKNNNMLGDSITPEVIDQIVTATIKKITDDNLFVGPKGDKGDKGEKGDPGQDGDKGDPGEAGAPGRDGADGKDADPAAVANILKADSAFLASIKGADGQPGQDGPKGDKGDKGDPGEAGADGKDADPSDVADALKADGDFVASVKGDKGDKGDPGQDGTEGAAGRDADPSDVANVLKADNDFLSSVKGDKGEKGDPGADGTSPVATDVADVLKADADFLASVKGDKGEPGDVADVEVDTSAIKDEVIKGIQQDIKDGYQHILNDTIEMGMFTANDNDNDYQLDIAEPGIIPLTAPVTGTVCNMELTDDGKIKLKAGKTYMISMAVQAVPKDGQSTFIGFNIRVYPSNELLIPYNQVSHTTISSEPFVSNYTSAPIPFKAEEDCTIALEMVENGEYEYGASIQRSTVTVMEISQPIVNEIKYADTLLEFGRFGLDDSIGYISSGTVGERVSFDHKTEYGTLSLDNDGYIMLHGGKRYSIDVSVIINNDNTGSNCTLCLYDATHNVMIPNSFSHFGTTNNNFNQTNTASGVIFAPEEDCAITLQCYDGNGPFSFQQINLSVQEIAVPTVVQYGSEDIKYSNFAAYYLESGLPISIGTIIGFLPEYSDIHGVTLDSNGYIELEAGKTYVIGTPLIDLYNTNSGKEFCFSIWNINENTDIFGRPLDRDYGGYRYLTPVYSNSLMSLIPGNIIYTPETNTKIGLMIEYLTTGVAAKLLGIEMSVYELAREVIKDVKYPNYDLEVGTFVTAIPEAVPVTTGMLMPMAKSLTDSYTNINLSKDGYIPLKGGKLYKFRWNVGIHLSRNASMGEMQTALYDVTNDKEIGSGNVNWCLVTNNENNIWADVFYKPDTDCEVVIKVKKISAVQPGYYEAAISVQEIAIPKIYNMKYDNSDIEYGVFRHIIPTGSTLDANTTVTFVEEHSDLHNMSMRDGCFKLTGGKAYSISYTIALNGESSYTIYGLYDTTHDTWLDKGLDVGLDANIAASSVNQTNNSVERIYDIKEDCYACIKTIYVQKSANMTSAIATVREIARPVKEEIVYDTKDVSYAKFDTGWDTAQFKGYNVMDDFYVRFGNELGKKHHCISSHDDISLTEEGYVKLKAGKTYKLTCQFICICNTYFGVQVALYDMTHHTFVNRTPNWTEDNHEWAGCDSSSLTYNSHSAPMWMDTQYFSPEEDTAVTVIFGQGNNAIISDARAQLFVEEVRRPVIEKHEVILSGQIPEVGTYVHRNYPINIGGLISFANDRSDTYTNLELTSEGYIVLHKGKTYKIAGNASCYLTSLSNYVALGFYNVTEGKYIGGMQEDGITPENCILTSGSPTGIFSVPDIYFEAKEDTIITLKVITGNGVVTGSNFGFLSISVQEIMQPVKLEAKPEMPECGVFESVSKTYPLDTNPHGFDAISPISYCNMKMDENGFVKLKGGKKYSLTFDICLGKSQTVNSSAARIVLYNVSTSEVIVATNGSTFKSKSAAEYSDFVEDIIYAPEEDCLIGFVFWMSDVQGKIIWDYLSLKVMEIAQPIIMDYKSEVVEHALCLADFHDNPISNTSEDQYIHFTTLENSNMELNDDGFLKLTAGKTYMIYTLIYSAGAASWSSWVPYDVTHDKSMQYMESCWPSQIACNASSTDNSVFYPIFYTPEEDCLATIKMVGYGHSSVTARYAYMTVLEIAQPVVDKRLMDKTKDEMKAELKQEFVTAMQSQVLDDQPEIGSFGAMTDGSTSRIVNQDEYIPLICSTGSYTNMTLYDGKVKLTGGKTYLISCSMQTLGANDQIGWNIKVAETNEYVFLYNQNVYGNNLNVNISPYQSSPTIFKPETDCHIGPYISYIANAATAEVERVMITVQEIKQPVTNNLESVSWVSEERVVGTWFNGKPLYEKMIRVSPDTNWSYTMSEDIDMLYMTDCITVKVENGITNIMPLDANGIGNWWCNCNPGQAGKSVIGFNLNSSWTSRDYGVGKARYTKTNDTATS